MNRTFLVYFHPLSVLISGMLVSTYYIFMMFKSPGFILSLLCFKLFSDPFSYASSFPSLLVENGAHQSVSGASEQLRRSLIPPSLPPSVSWVRLLCPCLPFFVTSFLAASSSHLRDCLPGCPCYYMLCLGILVWRHSQNMARGLFLENPGNLSGLYIKP